MKRSRRAYLSVGVTVLIVAAVIFVLICLNTSGETAKVVLPDPDSLSGSVLPSGDPSGNPDVAEDLLRVEMTPQTVQTAIRTLRRPEEYSRQLVIQSFWGDAGTTEYAVEVWVSGTMTRLSISQTGTDTKHILVTEDSVYIWYDNETSPHAFSRREDEDLTHTADGFSQIVTYEDVLKLDADRILEAGYREKNGLYYIYVLTEDPIFGYSISYYISVDTGLLAYAEKKDGDQTVYLMRLVAEEYTRPSNEVFQLPGEAVY